MSFFSKVMSRMGVAYRAKVGKELAGHGLLFEDVMIETANVKLALSRLPKDVLLSREQRLKRAMVLSSQSRQLPEEVQAKIDPFATYLAPYLEAIEQSNQEQTKLSN